MLSKLFGLFKSKPVEKQPEPPLVQLGPEKTETPVAYELIESPTTQQLEDAFKEEEKPKYEKDDGALSERQLNAVAASVPETKPPVKKRTAAKTPAKKVVKNGKSKS